MKYNIALFLIFVITACQHQTTNYRFDKKSLTDHYNTKNFNLLILWDQRIQKEDEQNLLPLQLKEFLKSTLNNNQTRILIAGLDGNPPHFFLSSNAAHLPTDYSSLFYSVEKLELSKFARRYNPNISILKSTKELIQNYTYKNFFLPQNLIT